MVKGNDMVRILVAVDGSELALDAVRHALTLVGEGLKAVLVLGHVQEEASFLELATQGADAIAEAAVEAGKHLTRPAERLVREAGLEPVAWSQTLYAPPWGPLLPLADGFEQIGRHVAPGAAGLILLEATRQAYARIRPSGQAQRVAKPALTPQPVAQTAAPPD